MESITKKDLEIFRTQLMSDLKNLLDSTLTRDQENHFEWLRSKSIRKMLNISPATLQNLRIQGKIRFKKVMGSYYYNSTDIKNLFENEH